MPVGDACWLPQSCSDVLLPPPLPALFKRASGIAESSSRATNTSMSGSMSSVNSSGGSKRSTTSSLSSLSSKNAPSGHTDSRTLVATVFRQYGMFLTSKHKHKRAAKYFNKAIAVDPSHAPTRTAYALVLAYHLRDYELAEQQLLRSLEIDRYTLCC